MKKSTKGALAAAAAGTLLLGGAGSLAYWTDTSTIDGINITSGHLTLTEDSCDDWEFDDGVAYGTQLLVPGDSLTRTCTYTIDADGDHMLATVDVDGGAATGFTPELTLTSTAAIGTGAAIALPQADVAVSDGNTVVVDLRVAFSSAATGSMDVTAVLDDITVTATQAHS